MAKLVLSETTEKEGTKFILLGKQEGKLFTGYVFKTGDTVLDEYGIGRVENIGSLNALRYALNAKIQQYLRAISESS